MPVSGRAPGSRVIAFATWFLALLCAGLMYVSFDAQYTFIYAQKGARGASLIEAAMLDAGMVILSALGIGLALAGKPSRSARFLIMICAGASAGMNVAAANPASWRSMVAYVPAPVFLAVITDRVIAVIRQHALPVDAGSAWAPLGRAAASALRLAAVAALYLLRTVLAPSGTLRGLRQMVLDAAPVPGMSGAGGCAARRSHPPTVITGSRSTGSSGQLRTSAPPRSPPGPSAARPATRTVIRAPVSP